MFKVKWRPLMAVLATGMMSFAGVLVETAMNVTFPLLMSEFGKQASQIQWVTTVFLLAIAVIIPITSYLVKNYEVKHLFMLANGLFIVGLLLDLFSGSFELLLVGRMIQGVGTGLAIPLMFHIVLNYVDPEMRGRVIGLATMTTALAPALGPTYGGMLASYLEWRSIFTFLIPLMLVSMLMGYFSMKLEGIKRTQDFNGVAFVSLAISLASLLMAIESLSVKMMMISLITMGLFIYFNRQKAILKLEVLKVKSFTFVMMGVLAYQATLLGISFVFPTYLQIVRHLPVVNAGYFMFPGALTGALLAPVAGYLFDKIGAFKPVLVGMSLSIVALVLLVNGFGSQSVLQLLLEEILILVGVGLSVSNLVSLALTHLPKDLQADGNSVLNTLQQLSAAISVAMTAQVFSLNKTDLALASQISLGILAGLLAVSLALFVTVASKKSAA